MKKSVHYPPHQPQVRLDQDQPSTRFQNPEHLIHGRARVPEMVQYVDHDQVSDGS